MQDLAKPPSIQSRAYQTFRAEQKAMWQAVNAPCALCGQRTINYRGKANEPDSFEMDHIVSRKKAIASKQYWLIMSPSNVQPSHHRCNRAKQAGDGSPALGEVSEDW